MIDIFSGFSFELGGGLSDVKKTRVTEAFTNGVSIESAPSCMIMCPSLIFSWCRLQSGSSWGQPESGLSQSDSNLIMFF